MSQRLRADIHPDFNGNPLLREVRDILKKTTPNALLRLLGLLDKAEQNTLSEGEDSAVFEYRGEEVIDNLDKALEKSKVNLDVWTVDRKEFKTYTVTMKIKQSDKTEKPVTKTNYYCKISFKRKDVTMEDIYNKIKKALKKKVKVKNKFKKGDRVGVVSLADFHVGADIKEMVKSEDFDLSILRNYLQAFCKRVNDLNYDRVELNILGDLVESISGLNHPNSWKSLGRDMYGYNVIILTYKLLRDELILKINNLSDINIVPGNHDRFTIDKKVDNVGALGGLMAFMIEENIKGINVNYNDLILVREIDGVNYIMTHGDKAMSKKPVNLIADYGRSDLFNVVLSGHIHSRRNRTTQKISYVDKNHINIDSLNYREIVVPSLFTGNFYSESLGFSSSAGGVVTENNGKGKINYIDYTL